MNALNYPEKSGIVYFISVFLPGFIIALVLLYALAHEPWLRELLPEEPKVDKGGSMEDHPNVAVSFMSGSGGALIAIYSAYLIAAPFMFGLISDAMRHMISRFTLFIFKKLGCSWFQWLRWNFPTKEGFLQSDKCPKLSENILLRRADKSYLLYHTYEFFGNTFFAILISSVILIISPSSSMHIDYYILTFVIALSAIFCSFSMYSFWLDNEELCEVWGFSK
jgi:hypothetical protein